MLRAARVVIAVFAFLSAAGYAFSAPTGDFVPEFFSGGAVPVDGHGHNSFLSKALGSNMVLQRAPWQSVVWGFATPGTVVTTTMDAGKVKMTSKASAHGVWKQRLPATAASSMTHSLVFNASTGESAAMENVLFGDVYLCGGQSNMQFAMPAIENATEESMHADGFPLIRLFTVGQKTSSPTPLDNLQTIEQQWAVASHATVAGGGAFGYFSAVCWIFGREVFDALGGQVPIGLVSSNWGGTPVESWSTPEALKACDVREPDSKLYNSMIHPFTTGPMAITGFTWYQGEANVDERPGDEGAQRYSCTFPGMITAWRQAFQNANAFFGFVQLSTWCGDGERIAEMRTIGQMSALSLPNVGYATNADHGAGCNIHPPPKQYCAKRLANSAMALVYGHNIRWKSPSFKGQVASASPPAVTVALKDVSPSGLRDDQYPFNYLDGKFSCEQSAGKCSWAELQFADGSWVNATIAVAAGGGAVILSAPAASSDTGAPVASRYGWGAVPMLSVYDKQTGLPLLPWSEKCSVLSRAAVII